MLQRPFAGLVLSLSSRFFATVKGNGPVDVGTRLISVHVDSPQFGTTSDYEISFSDDGQTECRSSNPYVSNALRWAFSFCRLRNRPIGNVNVTLVADNDFYSMLDELKVLGK